MRMVKSVTQTVRWTLKDFTTTLSNSCAVPGVGTVHSVEDSYYDYSSNMLTIPTNDEEVNVISDDECDFSRTGTSCGSSTSRPSMRLTRTAQHHDDETMTCKLPTAVTTTTCDACRFCHDDVCDVPNCVECQSKTSTRSLYSRQGITGGTYDQQERQRLYTPCQIRRHNHMNSAWIVAGDVVYDVTSYIQLHPGGAQCILRKAGGNQNCLRDLQFHSSRGRQLFHKYAIGKVTSCPGCSTATPSNTATVTGRSLANATLGKQQRWFLW